MAGAEGVLNPGGITKTTGPQGQFYVQDLAPGSYTLTVSKAGFQTAGLVPVHITAGEMTTATVMLEVTA